MSILTTLAAKLTLDTKGYRKGLQTAESKTGVFAKGIGKLGPQIAAAFSVVAIIKFSSAMANMNKDLSNAIRAFERFGDAKLLDDLRGATGNMVGDLKLMQQAIQAVNLNLNSSDLPTFFKFATIRAAETGMEVDHLVESIVTGIGRESRLVLDNLGISLIALNKEIAKGGTFAEASTRLIKRVADESNTSIEQATKGTKELGAAWTNLITNLSDGKIGDNLNDIYSGIAKIVDKLAEANKSSNFRDVAITWFEQFSESTDRNDFEGVYDDVINQIRKEQGELAEELLSFGESFQALIGLSTPASERFDKLSGLLDFLETIKLGTKTWDNFIRKIGESGKDIPQVNGPLGILQDRLKELQKLQPFSSFELLPNINLQIRQTIGLINELKKLGKITSIQGRDVTGKDRESPTTRTDDSQTLGNLALESSEKFEILSRAMIEVPPMPAPSEDDIKAWQNMNKAMIETAEIMSNVLSTAMSLATDALIDIFEGGNVLDAFKKFISEMGKMMAQYGALLLAQGIAQKAFESGDGITKIIAGASMLALGLAVAASGASINSSGSSAGGGSYSSGSAGGDEYDYNREIVMVARGDDLVAVLNNTNDRNSYNF